MKEFKFADRSETIKVEGKEYKIDVSKYEFIKACKDQLADLEAAHTKFNENKDIEGLIDVMRPVINLILEDDFDRLWEIANHNIYGMIDLASTLTEIINKGFIYKRSKYVQPSN